MHSISEIVNSYTPLHLRKDQVLEFGDRSDGSIQFPGITNDGGVVEVSYFYGDIKPKNLIVISSQIGCPMRCRFCEMGDEKFDRNLSPDEMYDQVALMLKEVKERGFDVERIEHKVGVANTGEPLLNDSLVAGLEKIASIKPSFKISTILPHGRKSFDNLVRVADFASGYAKPVQMQVSLISTSEKVRADIAGVRLASFDQIRRGGEYWREKNPDGRKVNLSLILTEDAHCEVDDVYHIFPPDLFRFRFRNYVPTQNGSRSGLETMDDQRIIRVKSSFRDKGYHVDDQATPTPTETQFGLASNVVRRRYMRKKGM